MKFLEGIFMKTGFTNIYNKNMVGIYKITNPKGKIYIGQSINIERRSKEYKNIIHSSQRKLKNSIKKYGWENHTFEIIEECSIGILNIRERYWQEYFNVLQEGLNCRLTKTHDKSGKDSNSTKTKKSNSLKKSIIQYDIEGNFIKEWSSIKEAELTLGLSKISGACRGTNISIGGFIWRFKSSPLDENYKPHIHKNTNKPKSNQTKEKMSISGKGIPQPSHFSKLVSKPIIQYDLKKNFIKEWNSITEASISLNIDHSAISKCCRNIYKTTNGFIFKYKL
jgi:group I intron endonuclease